MSPSVRPQLKAACLAHVRERFEKAEAASSKAAATRTLNALLKTGGAVYRCPREACGAYSIHTACDDLRAHHLQLQSTDVLVTYSETFRMKVLDPVSVQRLTELYSLCASSGLKKQLPELDDPANLDGDGKPLRGLPVVSNACGSCGFLGRNISEWHRVCGDCKRAGQPVNRQPWGTCCRFCSNYLG